MAVALNILIVEDKENDAELMLAELKRAGYEVKWVRVQTEGAYLIELEKLPELILSDYALPSFNGLRAVQLLRDRGLDIPFILISGALGEEKAVEAMRQGATDYLLKDRIARLGNAVKRALDERRLREERRHAEEKLRATHAQLSHLLEHSPAVIYTLKLQGDDVIPHVVSENIHLISGYTVAESILPDWWYSHLHPEDYDRVQVGFADIVSRGTGSMQYRIRHKDGTYRWVEDNKRVVRDSNDQPSEIVGVWTDITERKKMEDELAWREQRLNAFFSGATAGLALLDKDCRFLHINETLAHINGLPVQAHLGKTIREAVPGLADILEPLLQGVLKTGDPIFNIEVAGETRSQPGVRRHWVASYFPILNQAGSPEAVGAIVVEITERKRMEVALRESEERFSEMAENINEVFWMLDLAKNRMIFISPAYEKIWEESLKVSTKPEHWLEAIHPEDRARVNKAALTQQVVGTYDEQYRIVRPDGAIRWIRDRAFPVRNEAGSIYRIAGIAEDITERRQLEEQFLQSQKMDSIGQLAGGIAHDFNNILGVILGHASLVQSAVDLSVETQDSVDQIAQAAKRAAALTRQLLAFSRKQVMQPGPLDLNESVGDLTKMLHRLVGENIALRVRATENLPLVQADAGMMEQVLMNLAINARDAMPDGGELIIETQEVTVDEGYRELNPDAPVGRYVCLIVTDTGTGIPPDVIPRIFEPFFTTKEVGKGTGLGLATVYGIVRQHGGWIKVYSEAGNGTVFRVYLPAIIAPKPKIKELADEIKLRGGSETILLVEDENPLRALVRNILERFGYKVFEAETGGSALNVWNKHQEQIDMLLTDMIMPGGMTGRELGEKLREAKPSLKVIYTSAYSAEVVGRNFSITEGVNFLHKPYNLHTLVDIVRSSLDREPEPAAVGSC